MDGADAANGQDATVRAELRIRHSRRHMPTRRVAVEDAYLPAGAAAPGAGLLGAIVAEFAGQLPSDDRGPLLRLVREARDGLSVPRIAMRHRLQTDTHGLDRSRHRVVAEHGRLVVELDVHGRSEPQVLGAVMAAAGLGETGRDRALHAIDTAIRRPGENPVGFVVRRTLGAERGPIPLASRIGRVGRDGPEAWGGIPPERRWAMEVLGIRPGPDLRHDDVLARFRRLLRHAHPDHGGAASGAAERIAELREARERLLAAATAPGRRG